MGSQLIIRHKGSLTKHLPTLLLLITTTHLLSYHSRLHTPFPGTNHTKGKVFTAEHGLWEDVRPGIQAGLYVKCFINLPQPQLGRFQWPMPQDCLPLITNLLSCTDVHGSCLHCDSSSAEESKKYSFLLFKVHCLLAMHKLLHCLHSFLLPEFSMPALQFIQVMLRSLFPCIYS